MDDRVVDTQVGALQDVLLRSLVLNIVLIPEDDHSNDHDDDCDDDDEYIILSTEVYLSVVVYVAPNLNNWSITLSLHTKNSSITHVDHNFQMGPIKQLSSSLLL